MGQFSDVRNVPGVYLLLDLDEQPLYVGKSGKLRGRLEQHFVRQDSSATADGLLDVYDVLRVVVWYSDREPAFPLDAFEAAAFRRYPPRWNRAVPQHPGPLPELALENADMVIGILDSPEELAVRRQPLERIEAKLLHLVRAVRKAKISGASPAVRKALARHAQELSDLFERSLESGGSSG
jgi:hypothetical protein